MPDFFNDFFDNSWMNRPTYTAPAINVIENEKEYDVELAAPGLDKEDFKVHVDEDNNLHIEMEKKSENKEGKKSWRYFGRDQIDKAKTRREVESIPFEERKKRNNVEATIFQYCFHTRNNKTRYRGLIKHKMQALARCAWINMRRLLLFDLEIALQRA